MKTTTLGVLGITPVAAGLLLGSVGAAYAGDPEVTITTLVKQGDSIAGHGEVGNLPIDVNVNNSGYWLATLPMVNPTGRVILTSDGVHMADGDILPGGIEVTSLANLHKGLSEDGDIIHRPSFGDGLNSGVVWNGEAVIMHDQLVGAPGATPKTPYTGFWRAKFSTSETALLMATVNDPDLSGTVHRAMVWLSYNESTGTVTESLLAMREDALPGQAEGVLVGDFGTNSERWAVNSYGDAIYAVSFIGGDTATNAAIYVNHIPVAQKGDFGPFKDVTYNMGTSSTTRVNINDHGDYIMIVPLAGGPTAQNQALLRNNLYTDGIDEVIIRKGDAMPFVSEDAVLLGFGTGAQPFITNNGDVVWYGQWSSDSGNQSGLFINNRLIVHNGVTETSDGDLITNIAGTTNTSNGLGDGFAVSRNGRYIVARAVLNASTTERSILMIEVEDTEPKCPVFADLNCDGVVNVSDMLILFSNWGVCDDCYDGCVGDLNNSCHIDVSDLLLLFNNWG